MAISALWKLSINGAAALTFEALGLSEGVLTRVSQLANSLVLTQDLDTSADAAPLAYGDIAVLTRDGVVWFRGTVRDIDESVDRVRTYTILGGWDVLERTPYLQTFKAASDPANPTSGLVDIVRGRIVLNQAASGARIDLAAFLGLVITYAGLTVGTIDVAITIPFEDATDLSCADVITRSLRWVPGSICVVDDTTSPATVHIRPRSALSATTLTFGTDPIVEPLRLKPRYDLKVDRVALFYVATNRANQASWETCTADVYPSGTTGSELGCLTRTIELAGSISQTTRLTQKVVTAAIPPELTDASLSSAWVKTGSVFTAASTFWKNHKPELKRSGVTLVAFRSGTRTKVDGSAVTADLRELVSGGLTDWMKEASAALTTEDQRVEVDVAYTVQDAQDSSKTQQVIDRLSVVIRATNAQTKTYSQLTDASSTEAEEVPSGLAATLYAVLNPLQWEGTIPMVEDEPTDLPSPGVAINISGGSDAWETMATPVQLRTTTLSTGTTQITVGPPSQLGVQDLVEIYRNNRNRKPSTSYLVRATGKTGGASGTVSAPLPTQQAIEPAQGTIRNSARTYTQALTVAGTVPTAAEITTALAAVYSTTLLPCVGDIVNLTLSGTVKLRSTISSQGTASGVFVVAFTIGGVTFYGHQTQTGLY